MKVENSFYEVEFEHPFPFPLSLSMKYAGGNGAKNIEKDVFMFISEFWAREVRPGEPYLYFDYMVDRLGQNEIVARNGEGAVIGYRGFKVKTNKGPEETEYIIDNSLLVIHPEFRKKGIGTYLTEVAIRKVFEEMSYPEYPTIEMFSRTEDGIDFETKRGDLFRSEAEYKKYWKKVEDTIATK